MVTTGSIAGRGCRTSRARVTRVTQEAEDTAMIIAIRLAFVAVCRSRRFRATGRPDAGDCSARPRLVTTGSVASHRSRPRASVASITTKAQHASMIISVGLGFATVQRSCRFPRIAGRRVTGATREVVARIAGTTVVTLGPRTLGNTIFAAATAPSRAGPRVTIAPRFVVARRAGSTGCMAGSRGLRHTRCTWGVATIRVTSATREVVARVA